MKKRLIVLLIINAIFMAGLGTVAVIYNAFAGLLPAQTEGERFAGESGVDFSQVSAFFPANGGLTWYDIRQLRVTLENQLELQAIKPLNPLAPLYLDAFSAPSGTSTVKSTRGSTSANIVAVGGDFFTFHPLRLRGGGYFYPDDLIHDRIVVDELAAWNLFGSYDVAGLTVIINNEVYEIAGVVQLEQDSASIAAYKEQFGTSNSLVFVPYEILDAVGDTFRFTTYEYVTQSLFTGYVKSLLEDEAEFSTADVVTNTGRFGIGQTYRNVSNFTARTLKTSAVVYPYWENAAILIENRLGILFIIGTFCAVMPVLTLCYLFGWLLKHSKGKWKVVVGFTGDVLDIWRSRRWKLKSAKAAKLSSPSNVTAVGGNSEPPNEHLSETAVIIDENAEPGQSDETAETVEPEQSDE